VKSDNARHSGHAAQMQYYTTPVPSMGDLIRDLHEFRLNDKEINQELTSGSQAIAEHERDGVSDEAEFPTEAGIERAGVTHLVHAWYAQGHNVSAGQLCVLRT